MTEILQHWPQVAAAYLVYAGDFLQRPEEVVSKAFGASYASLGTVNAELGKTQRLSALYPIDELPRSHIGKILKTDLRAMLAEGV